MNAHSDLKDRTPTSPPNIEALSDYNHRPLISVMIPTFNCFNFLEEALASVLKQDMGQDLMQIEVVDDCSQDGNVQELVEIIGKSRVLFYQQKSNVGSLRNFETCINRAKGHWIHILHGDDYVLPEFYQEIFKLINLYPNVGAAFTNNYYLYSNEEGLKPGVEIMKNSGVIDDWLFEISIYNKLQPPAIIVKRTVYEKLGSFYAVHYGEDWEMWTRIAAHYPFAYSPNTLAVYRKHPTNISSKTEANRYIIKDTSRVINIIQNYLPDNKKKEIKLKSKSKFSNYFLHLAYTNYTKNKNFIKFALHLFNILYFDFRLKNIIRIEKAFTSRIFKLIGLK